MPDLVDYFKYLSVTISNTLNGDTHIDTICSNALWNLGMLMPLKCKAIAYLTIYRPSFNMRVWEPFTTKHICKESCYVTCCLKGVASVTQVQEKLKLETLARRRKRAKIELLIKIISNDAHSSLIKDVDGLAVQQTAFHQHDTRSVWCSAHLVFHSNTNTFYHGFIQRTSGDIKLA